MSNYILYESILDDDDIIISQNKTASDLIGDGYLHSELKSDDEFDYMLIVSFEVWGSSSYHFINPDKPDVDDNKFPLGAFCQELNDILDYNMLLSKYQISRVVVNDRSSNLPLNNKNRWDYEIVVDDPLADPDFIFNIVDEYRAVGGEKFLGMCPVFNIQIPFIAPKKLPFMRMCNSIYQMCEQLNNRLGGFALDISDSFNLKFKTIHPTEYWDRPYTFADMSTRNRQSADQYKKIYKRIYGEDVPVSQYHDIMRYKILRNVNLRQYAEHAAQVCNSARDVTMKVTNIYEPPFDTNRYSSIRKDLLNKATKRTIPRIVGFEVNPGTKKEVDIDTLERILADEFITKLPSGYCSSCLLTICIRCNVNLKNDVHTSDEARKDLGEEIRERQNGYGRLYDYIRDKNRWVFNPVSKEQVKVETTECYNGINNKRSAIWRVVDMQGNNTPEIRVFFCNKHGRVNNSPITEITYYGEEYRAMMNVINGLMDSGFIWDSDFKFDYSRRQFGLW